MKKVKEKITAMLNAITFAEMNEAETALSFMDSQVAHEKDSLVVEDKNRGIHRSEESVLGAFEKSMSAAAFAEAGEFTAANEILKLSFKPHTVALLIDNSHPNLHAIDYTAHFCKRIGAIMDVLITESDDINLIDQDSGQRSLPGTVNITELTQFLAEKDVPYHMYILRGDIVEELGDYVRRHKEVTTVVYDSPISQNKHQSGSKWERVLDTVCNRLSIPLITVFDKRGVEVGT